MSDRESNHSGFSFRKKKCHKQKIKKICCISQPRDRCRRPCSPWSPFFPPLPPPLPLQIPIGFSAFFNGGPRPNAFSLTEIPLPTGGTSTSGSAGLIGETTGNSDGNGLGTPITLNSNLLGPTPNSNQIGPFSSLTNVGLLFPIPVRSPTSTIPINLVSMSGSFTFSSEEDLPSASFVIHMQLFVTALPAVASLLSTTLNAISNTDLSIPISTTTLGIGQQFAGTLTTSTPISANQQMALAVYLTGPVLEGTLTLNGYPALTLTFN